MVLANVTREHAISVTWFLLSPIGAWNRRQVGGSTSVPGSPVLNLSLDDLRGF